MSTKLIEFYPNGYFGKEPGCISFAETQQALEAGDEIIRTESMLHLSFSLIDKGYTVLLVSRKGARTKFYPGMTAPNGRPVRRGNNLTKMLLDGVFDQWL